MTVIRTLEFTPDAMGLVLARPGGLEIRELGTRAAITLPIDQLRAFATIGRELWVASGHPVALQRYCVQTGDTIARELGLPAARRARLARAYGNHVTWSSEPSVRIPSSADAVIAMTACDLVIPIGTTRAVECAGHQVTLRDQRATRWVTSFAPGGRAIDGEVLFDGRAIAIVLAHPSEQALAVIGLPNGAVQHRIRIPRDGVVRFASRRAVALVVHEQRRLVLIDLRYGRVLADHEFERSIADAAIDDAGQRVALRFDDPYGEVVEVAVTELVQCSTTSRPLLADAPPPPAPAPAVVTAAPVEVDPPPALAAIPGLPHRPPFATPDDEALRGHLEAERARLAALAGLAIARAWDRGVISYADASAAPFAGEVEGVVAARTGHFAAEVALATRRLDEAQLAALLAAEALAPAIAPINEIAEELGLSPLAREILWVVAAPQLWGELARLYGILANDPGRPLCDELLVSTLLVTSRYEIARELDGDAPLIRSGLLRVGDGPARPFLPLVVDRVALARLRGASPAGELGPVVVCESSRSFDELRIASRVKAAAVADLAATFSTLRLAVTGRTGSGRRSLAAAIARHAGWQIGVVDASTLPRDPSELAAALPSALAAVRIAGLLPCVTGLERALLASPHDVDRIREALESHPGPVLMRLDRGVPVPFAPGHVAIEIPATTIGERIASWEVELRLMGRSNVDVHELAARYRIGPGVISRVVEACAARDACDDAAIEREVRKWLSNGLGTVAHRVERLASWSQVILAADIQDSLTELVGRIRHRRTVLEQWGFDGVLSTGRGVTALFEGGPGTGKTLVAGAIANELGVDLYRIDVSRIMSKWVGETEQNLARLFDVAEDAHAVLLFDEADSLFAKRTEVKSANDRYANTEVNYLLQRLDSFDGIAILTTNFGTSIDGAFKRRLSFRLRFPFPDEEQRELLWRAHVPGAAPRGELDFGTLAKKYKLSGGYIRNCAVRAAFLAAEEGAGIEMHHLERSIQAEYRDHGKLGDGGILE